MKKLFYLVAILSFPFIGTAQTTYIWNGTTTDWTDPNNWTPARTPNSNDILTFDASANNKDIINIPSQTLGKILVTGSTAYSFFCTGVQTLTLSEVTGNAVQIDNGSSLANGSTANPLNFSMPAGGSASIGGSLNLVNGNFDASNASLTLHTNASPLARTSGQVSLNAMSSLQFGDASNTSGANILLPNSIFVSAPIISTMTMNRTNGATLGNQSITVTSNATFTLGDLTTNGGGRMKFETTAIDPLEIINSKIVGYAEMTTRIISTGAIDFLGFSMSAGADARGFVTIVRRTGILGTNIFNANQSIACSWDIDSGTDPASGRSLVFRWLPSFDNGTIATNTFQPYIFDSGPGWTALGTLQPLTASIPLRTSTAASTTKIKDTFTLTDQTQVLPVDLVYFNARSGINVVDLSWKTASESNFDFYSIEKSKDGKSFFEIGKVKGSGTSKLEHLYQFIDEKPMIGKNYYRLKSVDFDGYTEYFDVTSVEFSDQKQFAIFPNPNTGKSINSKINFNTEQDYTLTILNNFGGVIERYTSAQPELQLTFSEDLPSGIYYAKLSAFEFKKIVRFVVVK